MADPTRIPVSGLSPYQVVVGDLGEASLREELRQMLTGALGHRVHQVALVHPTDPALAAYVGRVHAALAGHGLPVLMLPVPAGEAGKSAAVVAECWESLGRAGFTRSDAIVTVGGGATTDLGGFVAATWLRGVRVVHVPTTLLAMVDAAVGGKTGINTGAGKNLVGSFHEPAGVVCDLTTLETLPTAELVAGLGEVVKCGFIADPRILDIVTGAPAGSLRPGSAALRDIVERAITVKAEVVAADLKETGGTGGHPGREVLNYGHTLAHAIERAEDYRIRHGEAVAIGCVFVAELAAHAGGLAPAVVDQHRQLFARAGLPTAYSGVCFDDLLAGMRVDKKARGAQLRFVVLTDIARPRVLTAPDEADLRAAFAAIGGRS